VGSGYERLRQLASVLSHAAITDWLSGILSPFNRASPPTRKSGPLLLIHAKEVLVRQHVFPLAAALTLMNAFSAHAQPQPSAANTSLRSAVVVLGDGTPLLSADRSGTSIGVVVRGTIYVFDAGPGVLRRLFEAQQRLGLGIVALGPVFVTHLHSDHTLGLPELLYRPGMPSLRVYGPPGIQKMLNSILDAWAEDRQVRSHS